MENDIISRAIRGVETRIAQGVVEREKKKQQKSSLYEKSLRKLNPGILTKGIVVGKTKKGILVSIGLKEEGVIPFDELSTKPFKSPEEVVNIGDKIDVIVLSNNNGNLVLSRKRAELKFTLDRIQKAFNNDEVLSGVVSAQVKGGLRVDVGIPGFVPVSQIKKEPIRNLEAYVGKEVRFKVIKFDRKKREAILSLKKVEEEEEKSRRESLLNELSNGKIVSGKVTKLTDFGAFVDLGGIDGLIPVSEISYKKIKHPKDVLKKGDVLSLSVIKIDRENQRVALSLKDTLPSPWENIEERLEVGSVVSGRISKITPTYAFVTVEDIEGFLPKRETDVLEEGQEVRVKVVELNPEKQRLTLSLKGVKEEEIENLLAKPGKGGCKLGELLQAKKWR